MAPPLAEALPRCRGVAHGRLAADPEPRDDRREPRHRLPRGDALPPLLVEGAEVELASVRGARTLPLEEFLLGVKRTALAPDELVTAVHLGPTGGPLTFMKVGVAERDGDRDLLALRRRRPRGGRGARSFGSAAETARRVALRSPTPPPSPRVVAEAAAPIDDVRATAAYRRHALRVLAPRPRPVPRRMRVGLTVNGERREADVRAARAC